MYVCVNKDLLHAMECTESKVGAKPGDFTPCGGYVNTDVSGTKRGDNDPDLSHSREHPPVGLIARVIQHVRKTKATGTLIAPCWPSTPFWPILFPEGGLPVDYVQEFTQLMTGF